GTGFPLASVTRTAGAGETVPPATVVAGIVTLAATADAGPVATLNAELVADASPAAEAPRRYPVPDRLISRFENVATPPTALAGAVPERVPPAGLVEMEMVMGLVAPVTVWPSASCTDTSMAGVIASPAVTSLGCCEKARRVAAPAVSVTGEELAPERLAPVKLSV